MTDHQEGPRTLVAAASRRLADAGVESPRGDAEAILAWAAGRPSSLTDTREIDAAQLARFEAGINRRSRREPLQHIIGTAGFRYLDLAVGPGVFVPRPETELLAGVAIDELRLRLATGARPVGVDLCTGSAAVAIAMATEAPGAAVVGVELSADAARYARHNASSAAIDHPGAVSVEIREGDMAVAVNDLAETVDVVTANPPYIPLDAFETVAIEARAFDPPLALWSGPDGLEAIRVVEEVAARVLRDGGLVACEHADNQGSSALAAFSGTGRWAQLRDHLDLAGRPRFITARRVSRVPPALAR